MSVRAKMICNMVVTEPYSGGKVVALNPVYDPDPNGANRDWSKWTPSGEVRLHITNPDAYEQFAQGKTYFVDFSLTE